MIYIRVMALLAFLLATQLGSARPVAADAVGRFTSVAGPVTQLSAEKAVTPAANAPVHAKDRITTGEGGTARLLFADESTISLGPNSRFEIEELKVAGGVRNGAFSLLLGSLAADVRNFIGGASSFVVRTPTAVAGVRGTGFEITVAMVGGQLTTTVTCTVGALSVSVLSATGAVLSTVTVVAGQTAVIAGGVIGVTATAAAAGAVGAAGAGAAAGAAAVAGVTTGTVVAGAVVAAAVATVVVSASGGTTTTAHH